MAGETELAAILCALVLGGDAEVRHDYDAAGRDHYVRLDCETDTHVIEVGLDDTRSAFDSVHQAIFAAHLTGKLPMVVIVDTNGREEAQEYQVETVARSLGVDYRRVTETQLIRLQMTAPFRNRPAPYLPGAGTN